jgi:hypothetical protein
MGDEGYMDLATQAPTKSPAAERVERANSNATTDVEHDQISVESPPSERNLAHNPFSRRRTTLDVDDYFVRMFQTSEHLRSS